MANAGRERPVQSGAGGTLQEAVLGTGHLNTSASLSPVSGNAVFLALSEKNWLFGPTSLG
jgi:hypothetical protein